jgi:uncharacterized protein (DUF3084 family)
VIKAAGQARARLLGKNVCNTMQWCNNMLKGCRNWSKYGLAAIIIEIRSKLVKIWTLQNAYQDLQNANQDLQNANQDLQNANQDLQNANQDLQNANQDLQTASEAMFD